MVLKFKNKFFSFKGQKQRLSNVVKTLKSAVTGGGVKSNTGIKSVDKVLSTAASRPFTTAFVATSAIKLAPVAKSLLSKNIIRSAGSKVAKSAGSKVAGSSFVRTAGLIGAGAVAGSLLGKGGAKAAPISTAQNQSQQAPQQTDPFQFTDQRDFSQQFTRTDIFDSPGASVGVTRLGQSLDPQQSTNPFLSQGQTATSTPTQTTTGSSDLLIPALIIGGLLLFTAK